MNRHVPLLLLLAACQGSGWSRLPALWSADSVVAANDGLYVPLDGTGRLARLRPGADAATVVDAPDLRLREAQALPDASGLLTRWSQPTCEGEPIPADELEDCPSEDRGEQWTTAIVRDGVLGAPIADAPWFTAWQLSDDGRYALSFVDSDGGGVPAGTFVNLGAMRVLDLQAAQTWEVAVGTGVNEAVFLPDAAGATVRVAVLRRNEVAMVDVTSPSPSPFAVYPLTLEPTASYQPASAAITPDLSHLLVTVHGLSDLYVLDLVNPSVNLIGLGGPPTRLVPDPARDRTVILYSGTFLDLLDHTNFSTTRLTLPMAPTHHAVAGDQLFLWRQNQVPIVTRVDLSTDEPVDYPLDNAVREVHVAPDASFALAVSAVQGRVDLLSSGIDGRGRPDTDPRPFATGGNVTGVAFDPRGDGSTDMLLLLSDSPAVYRLGWPSLAASVETLPGVPTHLGAMPEGGFWMTHTFSLGMVSFLSPEGALSTQAGFAADGALQADDTRTHDTGWYE